MFFLLLEDATVLLTEDGDRLILNEPFISIDTINFEANTESLLVLSVEINSHHSTETELESSKEFEVNVDSRKDFITTAINN